VARNPLYHKCGPHRVLALVWFLLVEVEDKVLREGFDAKIVQNAQNLGAVIGAMVKHLHQYLP